LPIQRLVVPTKKKSKAAKAVKKGPPDPREPLEPTPANLTSALKQLKAVLADIPIPDPIIEEPEPEPAPPPSGGGDAGGGDASGGDAGGGDAGGGGQVKAAEQKEAKPAKPKEPIVRLPQLDYVDAMLHIYFAHGLSCGYGQEVRRRIEETFVDRNEFRVTEAFEVEELLQDLEIPDLFQRCLAVRESVAQVYNDQNGVHMTFLRDAGIGDRTTFFQRVPAIEDHVVSFISNLLTIEEVAFSEKSTLRAQQRIGLDPKSPAAAKFVDELRACLKPYGHIPVSIGPHGAPGKPSTKHKLSPACILVRLAPIVKVRRR
jgi:hypothetical protein